jgi:hypothetical protein
MRAHYLLLGGCASMARSEPSRIGGLRACEACVAAAALAASFSARTLTHERRDMNVAT